jgi:predicted nucleotidyltransferase component of viral defense system
MADRAASVLARLRNLAAASGRPYQLCLQLFCQEEFLRRLAASEHKNRFVLKGGHLIYCLTGFSSRPTLDIDFLVQNTDNSLVMINRILADIIDSPSDNDFIDYAIKDMQLISLDKKYPGVSAILEARIKNTRTPIKIDFAFGDVVHPCEQVLEIPTQLSDFISPLVSSYPIETIIAEKIDAILDLMEFSSRMKDFYDLYTLSSYFKIDRESLRTALIKTFTNRERKYQREALSTILSFEKNEGMQKKWDAFIRKTKLPATEFSVVLTVINDLIGPFWESLYPGR